jgi:hypothetical protein
MRKGIVILTSFAAVAAALVSISAVGASASSSRPTFKPWGHSATAARGAAAVTTVDGAHKLVLNTKSGRFKPIDADQNGRESVGDSFLFTESLWNAGGDRIGKVWAICTDHFNGAALCQASIRLAGRGTLRVAGVITPNNPLLAVTGGTDEFSDSGGEMDTSGDNGDTGQLVIWLRHLG